MSAPVAVVLVATPGHARTLRHCLASFGQWAEEPWTATVVTEPANVEAMRAQRLPAEIVAMPPAALAIGSGYLRQMGAKLLLPAVTQAERIVITDDDTEAIAPWSGATFFNAEGRARMFFERRERHFWRAGSERVFDTPCPRRWQLRLPFAIRRTTLARLGATPFAARCLAQLRAGDRRTAEFETMGEFAFRTHDPDAAIRAGTLDHWTLGLRPCCRDWQGMRRRLERILGFSQMRTKGA